ncbi:carboxylate--amine ligase [Alkalithermobacter paradoxus]|uniref:D-aspartate ligase n=1 Tax=Alkalithermobacter paradoxus TaxID=29349 RepID=A0A1V4I5J2_9FIRM|nr:D-aspartate ligase [[Clostridium] thermoalcaliphilum]
MKHKAVVLGANYYIGLSVIRCLGVNGVHVVAVDYSDKNTYGFYSKYCSETLVGPHYKKDPEAFLEFLIEYAKKQDNPPVLFPCADPYVEFLDKYLSVLRKYFLIPQTEENLYTKLMNKDTLRDLAIKHDVLVPETLTTDDENLIEKVEEIIKYPCLVKPVDSHAFVAKFRKKLFKVYNKEELISSIKLANKENIEVIVQRIIPGFDDHMYTFDAYLNQDAKITHWVTCQKMRQYPINFGASVYTQQKYVPELYEIGSRFLEGVKFKGFAEIEFKKDSNTGKYYLIEVNVRTTNLNNLLYKVGINMPYIAYMELTGSPLSPKAITSDKNLVFWYAYEDFLAVKGYIKTKQLTLLQVIKSYFRPKAYAIWDYNDPQPFIVFLRSLLDKISGKLFK